MVHAAVIAAAVKVTAAGAEAVKNVVADTTMVFLKPPPPPPPPPDQPPPDVIVVAEPPAQGVPDGGCPHRHPEGHPARGPGAEALRSEGLHRKGAEGGLASGIVGGTGPVDVAGVVYTEGQLDDPVQPISIPTPRYPPVLQSAGIAGSVDLQYVVDTTGHAEPNSFKVMKSTHPAFAEPAKEAIIKGVFKPAKFKGQPVRQLVQQRISFKVGQ